MRTLAERVAPLEEELEFLDREEKFEWLIDRGKSLKTETTFTDADIVKGCQSQVWMQVSLQNGLVHLVGTSDALIVKGIIGLLVEIFDGAPASEVAQFDFIRWMGDNGIGLSFQRMQGLEGMLKRIRSAVQ